MAHIYATLQQLYYYFLVIPIKYIPPPPHPSLLEQPTCKQKNIRLPLICHQRIVDISILAQTLLLNEFLLFALSKAFISLIRTGKWELESKRNVVALIITNSYLFWTHCYLKNKPFNDSENCIFVVYIM